MYGSGIGDLNIYANNQRIFSKSGDQGNRWVGVETPISQSGSYMVCKERNLNMFEAKPGLFIIRFYMFSGFNDTYLVIIHI
jgi:hypothetical protein